MPGVREAIPCSASLSTRYRYFMFSNE
jgi:hypothetical protein